MNDGEKAQLAALEVKLDVLIEQIKEDNVKRERWRDGIETRLTTLEDFFKRIDAPVRFVGWALVIVVGYALKELTSSVIVWIKSHIH